MHKHLDKNLIEDIKELEIQSKILATLTTTEEVLSKNKVHQIILALWEIENSIGLIRIDLNNDNSRWVEQIEATRKVKENKIKEMFKKENN